MHGSTLVSAAAKGVNFTLNCNFVTSAGLRLSVFDYAVTIMQTNSSVGSAHGGLESRTSDHGTV